MEHEEGCSLYSPYDGNVGGHGLHICSIPRPVSLIPIIWLTITPISMPTNCTLTFFLFYRGHWIAFQIMPKHGRVVVHDSLDWRTDVYQKFIDLIQLWVNFLSSIWTSASCVSREICLHKLTFHIFNLKQGIQVQRKKRTSLPRWQKANDFSHKFL